VKDDLLEFALEVFIVNISLDFKTTSALKFVQNFKHYNYPLFICKNKKTLLISLLGLI